MYKSTKVVVDSLWLCLYIQYPPHLQLTHHLTEAFYFEKRPTFYLFFYIFLPFFSPLFPAWPGLTSFCQKVNKGCKIGSLREGRLKAVKPQKREEPFFLSLSLHPTFPSHNLPLLTNSHSQTYFGGWGGVEVALISEKNHHNFLPPEKVLSSNKVDVEQHIFQ